MVFESFPRIVSLLKINLFHFSSIYSSPQKAVAQGSIPASSHDSCGARVNDPPNVILDCLSVIIQSQGARTTHTYTVNCYAELLTTISILSTITLHCPAS